MLPLLVLNRAPWRHYQPTLVQKQKTKLFPRTDCFVIVSVSRNDPSTVVALQNWHTWDVREGLGRCARSCMALLDWGVGRVPLAI